MTRTDMTTAVPTSTRDEEHTRLLAAAVAARHQYWQAFYALEDAMTDGAGWHGDTVDRIERRVSEFARDLGGDDQTGAGRISGEHLAQLREISSGGKGEAA